MESKKVNFFEVDGSDAEQKELRSTLFNLSGLRGKYPQVFLQDAGGQYSFVADWDEFAWGPGPGYTEAGPWQYRVEAPQDPQGLKAALAAIGQDGCAVIQQANTILSTYHAGGYGERLAGRAACLRPCACGMLPGCL